MKQNLRSSLCSTLLVLLTLLLLPQAARAQSEKAIMCNKDSILYFVYDNNTYAAGDTFTDDEGNNSTISYIYTEFLNKSYYYYYYPGGGYWSSAPWGGSTQFSVATINFQPSFKNCASTSFAYWFSFSYRLTKVKNEDNLNTSNATNMTGMFRTSTLSTIDVSNWDLGNVTKMDHAFQNCSNLTTLDVSNWDMKNVMTLDSTFMGCKKLTSLDVSNWDTGNFTSLNSTFSGCESITPLEVSNWDMKNVTSMDSTFCGCTSLTTLDVSKWDTGKTTSMSYTFKNCTKLTTLDVSNWNTENVRRLSGTFYDCRVLTPLDVSNWNTGNATTMAATFYNCKSLTSLDVSNWNTENVTNMQSTFSSCNNLTSIDVSKWNTAKVIYMGSTFANCWELTSIDVSKWNTANVTSLYNTFRECSNITSLDVTNWNTEKVKSLEMTFLNCRSLTSLDVSNWDTKNVTTLYLTFDGCSSLTSLDVSNWNTEKVTTLQGAFQDCSSLTSLDVSNWDTENVTRMYWVFSGCSNLTSLTFGNKFSLNKLQYESSTSDMFKNCSSLRFIDFYNSDDTDAITSVNRKTSKQNPFNNIPTTCIIYLPHGSQTVTDQVNVVYSYGGDETDLRCPNYYSEDKVDIELPHDFKTNKAEYSRAMSSNYGSVILPYDFTTNDDVQAYTLNKEYEDCMYFVDAETIPAHTPFAFKKKGSTTTVPFTMEDSSGEFGITVYATRSTNAAETTWDGSTGTPYTDDAAAAKLSGWSTKGYYVAETVSDYDDAFYIASDKFYKADGALTMYPHRVTFHDTWTKGTPSTDGGARYFNINTGDDETLAIEAADLRQTEREARAIYDARGIRRNGLSKGLNVVRMQDGTVKKIIVRP